jgi:oxidoreductase
MLKYPNIQSGGADPASRFLYTRCKGLVEEDISSLGYADTIIFRPGVLSGTQRERSAPLETLAV